MAPLSPCLFALVVPKRRGTRVERCPVPGRCTRAGSPDFASRSHPRHARGQAARTWASRSTTDGLIQAPRCRVLEHLFCSKTRHFEGCIRRNRSSVDRALPEEGFAHRVRAQRHRSATAASPPVTHAARPRHQRPRRHATAHGVPCRRRSRTCLEACEVLLHRIVVDERGAGDLAYRCGFGEHVAGCDSGRHSSTRTSRSRRVRRGVRAAMPRSPVTLLPSASGRRPASRSARPDDIPTVDRRRRSDYRSRGKVTSSTW